MSEIVKRVEFVFRDKTYEQRADKSDKRWLDDAIEEVFQGILNYLKALEADSKE